MRRQSKDTKWPRAIALSVGVFALIAVAGGSAALADRKNPGPIIVSGDSTVIDPASNDLCEEGAAFALLLTGDLEGCWSVFPDELNITCTELDGFALYREPGREVFSGDWNVDGDVLSGEADTTYVFEAVFESGFCSSFAFETELSGSCIHYFKGRTGDFRGVTGQISFFDIIPDPGTSGASNFLYTGPLNRPER